MSQKNQWTLFFIGMILLWQIFLPIKYYAQKNSDDERFAWRMFSVVRLNSCNISVKKKSFGFWEEINLTKTIHKAWENSLIRNRPERLKQKFFLFLCQNKEVQELTLLRSCYSPTGSPLPKQKWQYNCNKKVKK